MINVIKKMKNIGMYAFLILVTFISVFPLYWMVSASTNKSVDVSKGVLSFGSHLGENLKNLLANQDVGAALVNSFKYAILLTIVSMVICSLAGYGFEIYHDKAKDAVMGVILLAMMVPFITILVPLFQMVAKMKMLNSTLGFILPTVSTPFLIMMFRQSARSFPRDIIEAARLDGLSEIRIFFQMFIPTMKSTYAAAMTITFMNAWNNYLWPTIILQDSKAITMPMLVAIQEHDNANGCSKSDRGICNRLWNAYVGSLNMYIAYRLSILYFTEEFCRRYYWSCKIINDIYKERD